MVRRSTVELSPRSAERDWVGIPLEAAWLLQSRNLCAGPSNQAVPIPAQEQDELLLEKAQVAVPRLGSVPTVSKSGRHT